VRSGLSRDAEDRPQPWYSYAAIEWLKPRIRRTDRVFEYGCGSSTLWFARTAREVVSVEHVRAWHDSVKQQAPDNVSMLLRPATDEAGDNISAPYAAAIGEVAPPFDVIVVDGSERNACARLAMRALAPHGIIIFDNSHRPQYAPGLGALAAGGLQRIDFYGLTPGYSTTHTTSVFLGDTGRWLDPAIPIRDTGF
jgi:predicted O-methyltransferase YrrM